MKRHDISISSLAYDMNPKLNTIQLQIHKAKQQFNSMSVTVPVWLENCTELIASTSNPRIYKHLANI